MAQSVTAELAASFAVLRRAPQAEDALPSGVAANFAIPELGGHWGVNPALARLAGTVGKSSVWLVPGRTGSCVYESGTGASACGPNATVQSTGAVLSLIPGAGNPVTVLGVIPDSASVTVQTSDSSAPIVARAGNAFSVAGALESYTITTPQSGARTFPITRPPSS